MSSELRKTGKPVPSALSGSVPAAQSPQMAQSPGVAGDAEPGWVTSARAYNLTHAGVAAEFSELTLYECLDDHEQLCPQLVARWQRAHSLIVDGKVGPQTLSSARVVMGQDAGTRAEGALTSHVMIEKARLFNASQPDLVAEFNELTSYFCFDFDRGELVPEMVAKWQIQHGEPADGMITADAIAVARSRQTSGAVSQ